MSIQSLNNEQRIIFLMEFVETLIFNSAQDQIIKDKIEAEKIKRKFLDKDKPYEEFGKSVIFKEDYDKSIFTFAEPKTHDLPKPKLRFIPRPKPIKVEIQPVINANKIAQPTSQIRKIVTPPLNLESNQETKGPLGKIDSLIKDMGVQLIECPGPGKNVLVKVRNKINLTKIAMNAQEIDKIIEYFSQEAKIPIINGILKAAVGDMVISAVSSQYAGSRFIITKKSPYSLISA
ncbi:hypothetical protein J4456_01370 [Candidatus Pacearchaeota archaeon]|nr:hypothetical protein [Candidatus Pacearchaeota archaeon]